MHMRYTYIYIYMNTHILYIYNYIYIILYLCALVYVSVCLQFTVYILSTGKLGKTQFLMSGTIQHQWESFGLECEFLCPMESVMTTPNMGDSKQLNKCLTMSCMLL